MPEGGGGRSRPGSQPARQPAGRRGDHPEEGYCWSGTGRKCCTATNDPDGLEEPTTWRKKLVDAIDEHDDRPDPGLPDLERAPMGRKTRTAELEELQEAARSRAMAARAFSQLRRGRYPGLRAADLWEVSRAGSKCPP